MTPLVSVIMPVYNGAQYLAEAVASIRRQSYGPIEIVVIDDGSTDTTAQIASGLNVIYLYQPNQGPAVARNAGLAATNGDVIAFLDVDDLWPEDKLAVQLPYLLDDQMLDIVMGYIQYIWMPGTPQRDLRFERCDNSLVHVHLGGTLFRRSLFERIGGFDPMLRYCEDIDLFLRARETDSKIRIVEQVTLYYRQHQGNMTNDRLTADMYLVRALKKSMDRRRLLRGTVEELPNLGNFRGTSQHE